MVRLFNCCTLLLVCFLCGWTIQGNLRGSDNAALKIERILQQLEAQTNSPSSDSGKYVFNEEDFNAFLSYRLKRYRYDGIEAVQVGFYQDHFQFKADVYMDKIVAGRGASETRLLRGLLGGKHQVELDGTLEVKDGWGTYRILGLSLDGLPISAGLFFGPPDWR